MNGENWCDIGISWCHQNPNQEIFLVRVRVRVLVPPGMQP